MKSLFPQSQHAERQLALGNQTTFAALLGAIIQPLAEAGKLKGGYMKSVFCGISHRCTNHGSKDTHR